jgi:1-deoxy-D-xylulose-5-phosphate reductoisomerase
VEALDIVSAGRLDFEAPDLDAFPCLALAQWAITQPGGMCVFSAANEIAVAAFLSGEIRFTDIDKVIDAALEATDFAEPDSLDAVKALDQKARQAAQQSIAGEFTRSES